MKRTSQQSIFLSSTKDFALSYRLALCGILLAGLLFIKFSLDQKKETIREKLLDSSRQIEKVITSDLDYIKYQLYYTARQIKMVDADKHKAKKLLSAFVTGINNQIDAAITWNAFSWIDKNDKLTIDGASGLVSNPPDMSKRDYLKYTKETPDRLFFGKARRGALSQRLIVPAGIGVISNKGGSYLGTLVFGFDIDRILAKIERNVGNETISFIILREGKTSFISNNFNSDYNNLITEYANKKQSNFISNQGIFSKNTPFIYKQKLEGYPLQIIAIYNPDDSYDKLFNSLLQNSFLILIIALFCILLFGQIYNKIINPLSSLSKFARAIAKRNFNFKINRPEGRELEELYSTLNLLQNAFKKEEELIKDLEEANKKISTENFNKSEFLAAISHDIRNPLAAISSFASLLKDPKAPKKEIIQWAQDIENCSNEVLQFINDLMDVNQTSSGEFSIDLSEKIDIADIALRSIRINRDFSQKRKIEIISKIEDNLPKIKLDPRRMKQIIVNLLSNSIKYSKEKTTIELSLTRIFDDSAEKLQITIKDHGFGMNEEQIKTALTKYGKIKNENTGKVDAFGLGLPLVKKLVELQNGTINIESIVGAGTKVVLTFKF